MGVPDETILWMVVRSDDNGTTSIIKDNLPQIEAMEMVLAYTAKGHKQLYQAFSYTPATKQALVARERINV